MVLTSNPSLIEVKLKVLKVMNVAAFKEIFVYIILHKELDELAEFTLLGALQIFSFLHSRVIIILMDEVSDDVEYFN